MEGGVRHHSPSSTWQPAIRRPPSATSPGSRPTPSPARTLRGCPPRPSGRGRRPGVRGTLKQTWLLIGPECGSGPHSHFGGYPGFSPHPYREYSEVFFGERLPRAARWLVGDASARCDHARSATGICPQRRQIFAGVRLARGGVMEPLQSRSTCARRRRPDRLAPRRSRGALAGRRRARRAHAPVQGAAAEALLRRPRRGAVRPDLRAARVLPHAHRARDPQRTRRGDRRADRRCGAGGAGLGHGVPRRACCSTR